MNHLFERIALLTTMRPCGILLFLFCVSRTVSLVSAAPCEGLSSLKLANTAIASARHVPAGAFTLPSGSSPPQGVGSIAFHTLPAFCRVQGVIQPSSDSHIEFEVWLPASGWNGKFQGIGNGGFAGSIGYAGLADAVQHGYAAASTDTGHQAAATVAVWALGHPEKIIDFGYRAIHETTERSKAIVAAYYGSGPKRSYFSSCSNGGRQALMEAQRYPADYDGIIAGAPANYWTHLALSMVFNLQATAGTPGAYIPPSKLPAIQAAALAACDAADGVKDDVIENPGACRTSPDLLLCRGAESDACLTAPQVRALEKLYDGTRDAKGRLLFPGYAPGGEADPAGWRLWITGPSPDNSLLFAFSSGFFRNMIFHDLAWDYKQFSVDRRAHSVDRKLGAVLNATDPDLKRFQERGGKLILYHGWSDAAIPPENTIDYYESVARKMGASRASSFVRLFMVPGMQHCYGGAGPSSFGQLGVALGDATHNIASALEQWVEQGKAPEQIVATKYKNRTDPASGIERTRPLCAYPETARYKGTGSTDDASNFECVAPARQAKSAR